MSSTGSNEVALFEKSVAENFSFLCSEFGFRLVSTSRGGDSVAIRYESGRVYLLMAYGPPSYEPSLSFGRSGVDDAPGAYSFDQGDVVQIASCSDWTWDASNTDRIGGFISEVARLMRTCGRDCLTGTESVYAAMRRRRDEAVKDWRKQERALSIRGAAKRAWERGDYLSFIRELESSELSLSGEEKRLIHLAKTLLSKKE
jgi:hypothetical protein